VEVHITSEGTDHWDWYTNNVNDDGKIDSEEDYYAVLDANHHQGVNTLLMSSISVDPTSDFDPVDPYEFAGLTDLDSDDDTIIMIFQDAAGSRGPEVTAHEIGHELGLAPIELTEADYEDPNYPNTPNAHYLMYEENDGGTDLRPSDISWAGLVYQGQCLSDILEANGIEP
jgi:hypothetical protein